jgi:hypothetical protein
VEREASKAAQRAANQHTRELEELEGAIKALEARLAGLSRALELAGSAQEVERVRGLGIEYRQVEAELQTSLARWAEVAG